MRAERPVIASSDRDAGPPQIITNGSGKAASVTLATFGIPDQAESANGRGYTITRSYFMSVGTPLDITIVAQGTRLVVTIKPRPKITAKRG